MPGICLNVVMMTVIKANALYTRSLNVYLTNLTENKSNVILITESK